MPAVLPVKLSEHVSSKITKLLLIGEQGTGKTGSLISLLKAGYKIRMFDFDSGVDILRNLALDQCPEKIDNLEVVSIEENVNLKQMSTVKGAKAYTDFRDTLEVWDGGVLSWGPEHVLVIDSWTTLARCAYAYGDDLNPAGKGGRKDKRASYGNGMDTLDLVLSVLSTKLSCNVVVCAHIAKDEITNAKGEVIDSKEFPASISKAHGQKFSLNFNSVLQIKRTGVGSKVERNIYTRPTSKLELKASIVKGLPEKFPIDTGLASFFKLVQGEQNV